MQRNILITGANGQLGQSLKTLTEKNSDYNFIFVDKEEAELTDNKAISRLFETNSLYAVLHFAAYTAVDKAENNQEIYGMMTKLLYRSIRRKMSTSIT